MNQRWKDKIYWENMPFLNTGRFKFHCMNNGLIAHCKCLGRHLDSTGWILAASAQFHG